MARFPKRSVAAAVLATLLIVGGGGFFAVTLHADLVTLIPMELHLRKVGDRIVLLDELSTNAARMAAATGEHRYVARHDELEHELEAALQSAEAIEPGLLETPSAHFVSKTDARLDALEARAFSFLDAGQNDDARALLFSDAYDDEIESSTHAIATVFDELEARADARLEAQRLRSSCAGLAGGSGVILLLLVWLRLGGFVSRHVKQLAQARADLQALNESLDRRVTERTAELAEANRALRASIQLRDRMEMQVRQAQKLSAIGRLAAGVAHELNTPLAFVGANVEFIGSSAVPS
jgi:signal transduction histidine kinase